MTEDQIKHMVDRFLQWKLPENFSPDAGISFKAAFNEHTAHPMKHAPTGTNLFDAAQATEMVRFMLEGKLALSASRPVGEVESKDSTVYSAPERVSLDDSFASPTDDAHEEHPCGLCDTGGRCTFACEYAAEVPLPGAAQIASARYWAMLVLAAKVLDDLADPEAEPKKIQRIRQSCGRLRDEIKAVIAGDGALASTANASTGHDMDQETSFPAPPSPRTERA